MNNQNREQEDINNQEREARMDERVEMVINKRTEYKKEQAEKRENLSVKEFIDELIKEFPSELKQKAEKDIKEYKEAGLNEEQLKLAVKLTSERIYEGYLSKLTQLANKDFLTADTLNDIDNILGKEDFKKEDFKKIGYIFFDLNGLKAVNDITASHTKGDDFLKLAAKSLKTGELKEMAEANNLKMTVCHESGDEFSIKVISEDEIDEELLDTLIVKAQDILYNMDEAKDILDIHDKENAYRLYETEKKARGEDVEPKQSDSFQEFLKAIPEGYKFKAFMSAGASTLYEAIAMMNGKNSIKDGDGYERMIGKLMGSMLDKSNKNMDRNKKDDKERFRNSNDINDIMLARLWDIREGGKDLKKNLEKANRRIMDLKQENINLKAGYGEIQQLIASGATPDDIKEMINKIMGIPE